MVRLVFSLVLILVAFSSCNENEGKPDRKITPDYLSQLHTDKYSLDAGLIRSNIARLSKNDLMSFAMDRKTRSYYAGHNKFLWINRAGIYDHADTLIKFLRTVEDCGMNPRAFRTTQIEKDIERIKKLDFTDGEDNINVVMARLEYNLTRAYFRYVAGQHYGFVNPDRLYNSIEKYEEDSTTTKYRQLCDLRVLRPDEEFYDNAIRKIANDSLACFLNEIQPKGSLYRQLILRLKKGGLSYREKLKTICNIERCKWRMKTFPVLDLCEKYVAVNIPSYCLRVVDKACKDILYMRVGCGTVSHKTPLLSSRIKRMDVNPQWIVPKSIAKGYVYDYAYMHKMGMFIYDKKSGKLPPEASSYDRIMSGEQYIIQAGGPKNSLGRIIFRFDNNFSVFLHDTSSPWLFQKSKRAISHGCVRVEKPFELALSILNDKNEELIDKLKYSMTMRLVNDNDSLVKRRIDKKRIVNSLSVKPSVPLFITYYTIYYDNKGNLTEYDDIYGYDEPLIKKLAPIIG